jgi:hypothetical protein
MRVLVLSLIALSIVPVAGNAQAMRSGAMAISSPQSGSETSTHIASGPTIESAAVGFRLAPSKVDAVSGESKARRRSGDSQDIALIIVGVAAMIAGGVIGGTAGTIFLVGGAFVGLYGLYNLLQ